MTYHTHCNSGICRTPTSTTKGSLDRTEPRARCRGKTDSCQLSMLVFRSLRQRSRMICCLVARSSTALVSNRSHTMWLRKAGSNTRQVSSSRVRVGRQRVNCDVPDDACVRWMPALRMTTSVKQKAAGSGSLLQLVLPRSWSTSVIADRL